MTRVEIMQGAFSIIQLIIEGTIAVTAIFAYLKWKKQLIGAQVYDTLVKIRLNLVIFKDTFQYYRFQRSQIITVETEENKKAFQKRKKSALTKVSLYLTKLNREIERYKASGQTDNIFLKIETDKLEFFINDLSFAFDNYLIFHELRKKNNYLQYESHQIEYEKTQSYLFKNSNDADDSVSIQLNEVINQALDIVLHEINLFFK